MTCIAIDTISLGEILDHCSALLPGTLMALVSHSTFLISILFLDTPPSCSLDIFLNPDSEQDHRHHHTPARRHGRLGQQFSFVPSCCDPWDPSYQPRWSSRIRIGSFPHTKKLYESVDMVGPDQVCIKV